ncbi:MAG: tRNA 2-thiouridine(34) synthase MnmA [Proteobacteria bacterium]|nr:tRNA 2-thiouridine(34) synthase MnmA [Pseudomonadota bacterium]
MKQTLTETSLSGVRVAVAMSGGVDSSVAAWLLKRAGGDVLGVTALFRPESTDCGGGNDARTAALVCRDLGVEHVVLDGRRFFERRVIGPFVAAYAQGRTPNPCVVCNARAKFGWLLAEALARGAGLLATGHYARRVGPGGAGLAEGVDRAKSQAYFLARVTPAAWRRVILPLGWMTKEETRALARAAGLPTAEREESQEVCFVPHGDPARMVEGRRPSLGPGLMLDPAGRELGAHQGLHHFTVGQRRGLGLTLGHPAYVLDLDPATNAVTIGRREDLLVRRFRVSHLRMWTRLGSEARLDVRVRYRQRAVPGRLRLLGHHARVEVDRPVRAVAPGQLAVFYHGRRVAASGWIERNQSQHEELA